VTNLNAESAGSKRGQLAAILQEQTNLVIEIDQVKIFHQKGQSIFVSIKQLLF